MVKLQHLSHKDMLQLKKTELLYEIGVELTGIKIKPRFWRGGRPGKTNHAPATQKYYH